MNEKKLGITSKARKFATLKYMHTFVIVYLLNRKYISVIEHGLNCSKLSYNFILDKLISRHTVRIISYI